MSASIIISSATLMFTGEVVSADRDGNKIEAKAGLRGNLLSTNLPIITRGRFCPHVKGCNPDGSFLISAGCRILKSDWMFTAKVAAPISAAYPFVVYLTNLARVSGPGPTFFANWFAPGRIEWGTGADFQRRQIGASTLPVAGALAVTLNSYFGSLPAVGDDVKIYPACDGRRETCMAYDASANPSGKFDNYVNFAGNALAPVADPTTTGQPQLGLRGGKK